METSVQITLIIAFAFVVSFGMLIFAPMTNKNNDDKDEED